MSKSTAGGAGGAPGRSAAAAPAAAPPAQPHGSLGTLAAVRTAEKAIWYSPVEMARGFTADGQLVLEKTGTKKRVGFTEEDAAQLYNGGVFTHNHPGGGSFSDTDIVLASNLNLAEIRAVNGPNEVYSMRPPPGGWNMGYTKYTLKPAVKQVRAEVEKEYKAKGLLGPFTPAYVYNNMSHEVWLRVSKRLGLDYRYERETGQ